MRVGPVNLRAVAELSTSPEVLQQEDAVAERILAEARRLVPVASGTLRDSLTVEKVQTAAGVEYRVGWDVAVAEYGPYVEFGTEDTPAQPHLRPAAIKARGL